jgi:hypothetical protein
MDKLGGSIAYRGQRQESVQSVLPKNQKLVERCPLEAQG